ncbi:MAG: tryptophan--tRNA ligase [Ignavibacteriaceae bacterium]|nr:tryptophan--tRNA ligase [Ignavibacteriaceae bacterium]
MKKKRILSGMRPTGKLHIGHYVGALENWVQLQDKYESFHLIADYHVLTTGLNTENIYDDTIDMLIDWLAAGLDSNSSPMFRQSQIKEHTELFLIFSMLITSNRLERNPTVKEQARALHIDQIIYGHLGYPVLQAADILLYKGDAVPVGEDQVPHVEITREINSILLSDEPEIVKAKLRKAVTDPLKIRKNDPGRPEICLVFSYHKKFNPTEAAQIEADCRSGALGCVECKLRCAEKISTFLSPIIEKRKYYENNMNEVIDILKDGEMRAKKAAEETMTEVHQKMKFG